MTNREKMDRLDNLGMALFINKADWEIKDIRNWLEECPEDDEKSMRFWQELERSIAVCRGDVK